MVEDIRYATFTTVSALSRYFGGSLKFDDNQKNKIVLTSAKCCTGMKELYNALYNAISKVFILAFNFKEKKKS